MSHYIDAFVIPVPRASLDTYKRMSTEWGNAHLRHGALYYSDWISDDAQPGKVTSFPQAVQLKESMDPSKMPFDGKRMFWGGFETITELAGKR